MLTWRMLTYTDCRVLLSHPVTGLGFKQIPADFLVRLLPRPGIDVCWRMLTYAACRQVFSSVSSHVQVLTYVSIRQHTSAYVSIRQYTCTSVSSHVQVLHLSAVMLTYVLWSRRSRKWQLGCVNSSVTDADVCWRMLTYVLWSRHSRKWQFGCANSSGTDDDVCWRMLTYTDVYHTSGYANYYALSIRKLVYWRMLYVIIRQDTPTLQSAAPNLQQHSLLRLGCVVALLRPCLSIKALSTLQ